jgi:hypothetical protein
MPHVLIVTVGNYIKGLDMKAISIKKAKEISKETGYPQIIIFGFDPVSGKQHITTYGATIRQCKHAAQLGNMLKSALGWGFKETKVGGDCSFKLKSEKI